MKIPNFPSWYQDGTLKCARESQSSRNGPAPITLSTSFKNSRCIFRPCHLNTKYSSVFGHLAFVGGIRIGAGPGFVTRHLLDGAGMEARCALVFAGLDAGAICFGLFESRASGGDFGCELRQPFRLSYQH